MAQLTHFPDAPPSFPQQTSRLSKWLWGFMLLLCVGIAVYASTYFFYTPGDGRKRYYK